MDKIFCTDCEKYRKSDLLGEHLLYEGCKKCGAELSSEALTFPDSHSIKIKKFGSLSLGEKYERETIIKNQIFLIRPILRIYYFFNNVYENGKRKEEKRTNEFV